MSSDEYEAEPSGLTDEQVRIVADLQADIRSKLLGLGLSPDQVVVVPQLPTALEPRGQIRTYIESTPQAELTVDQVADTYVAIMNAQGTIEKISLGAVEDKLKDSIRAITNCAKSAIETGRKIANDIGGDPFELEEITVGLTISAEAGIVFAALGGESNLEFKFVRQRSSTT